MIGKHIFIIGGGSGGPGTTDHTELTHLDFASSGHTGFYPNTGGQIYGNVTVSGVISGSSFVGDGSQLSNISIGNYVGPFIKDCSEASLYLPASNNNVNITNPCWDNASSTNFVTISGNADGQSGGVCFTLPVPSGHSGLQWVQVGYKVNFGAVITSYVYDSNNVLDTSFSGSSTTFTTMSATSLTGTYSNNSRFRVIVSASVDNTEIGYISYVNYKWIGASTYSELKDPSCGSIFLGAQGNVSILVPYHNNTDNINYTTVSGEAAAQSGGLSYTCVVPGANKVPSQLSLSYKVQAGNAMSLYLYDTNNVNVSAVSGTSPSLSTLSILAPSGTYAANNIFRARAVGSVGSGTVAYIGPLLVSY